MPMAPAKRSHFQEQADETPTGGSCEIADGAEVGRLVADDGRNAKLRCSGRDLTAGADADAVAYTSRIAIMLTSNGGWPASPRRNVDGMPRFQLGNRIEHKEDQIVFGNASRGDVAIGSC